MPSSRACRRSGAVLGRPDLRRRAADDRDRPGADGAAAPDPARRAVDGPGAADRRGHLRHAERAQPHEGLSHPRRRAERGHGAALRATAPTCSRTARRCSTARRPSCASATTSRPSISGWRPSRRPGRTGPRQLRRAPEHEQRDQGVDDERPAQDREHQRRRAAAAAAARAGPRHQGRRRGDRGRRRGWPPSSPRAPRSVTASGACRSPSSTLFSQSGLWSINVPRRFGGPDVSYVTLARVIAIISAADPSIGQIPQNHLGVVAAIRTVADEAQQQLLFAEVLRGARFGNAFSEFGSKKARRVRDQLHRRRRPCARQRPQVLLDRRAAGPSRADRGRSMTRAAPGTRSPIVARRA